MARRGIRAGIVATMAAAIGSGAFLAFPAHAADTVVCTGSTGTVACADVVNSSGVLGAVVIEGTAPSFPDENGASVLCYQGNVYVQTVVNGKFSTTKVPGAC